MSTSPPPVTPAPGFTLERNPFGRLVLSAPDGSCVEGVTPVRAFPVAAPEEGVSLVGPDGHELAWVERLAELPAPQQALIREELATREFFPEIRRLCKVSGFTTPSTWELETDRGPATLVLKGEEDIRRLAAGSVMITDSHGLQFLIRDLGALDKASRRLLDRFLT
ncbi:DUF1854 domain-containing protein [Aquabacterium sp. A7-Y]|uniref:cyanophycin metabolism-associated DUF1854 family protein n=1 Tax=Aquabacterium sp. A7-Y TaxID=1349605 RepID=UPI00223D3B3F|nr:DUF1854 domain-containing protein [Aquabacterium sp. A7-Y]MCW7536569.1 DUF1854 domain-containing protein [Aquabacterium sp. A7-Y]